MTQIKESQFGAVTPRGEGRMLVQIITPGVGSSGVYSEALLRDAGERKIFAKGTQMFADHPSVTEAQDRPERSIKDLAGVLTEDAYWDGTALVAEAKTFEPWRSIIREMHDAIGVSIRAAGNAEGVDESGRPIITSLDEALSVDFVTKAGRGGAIRELYEAHRPTFQTQKITVGSIHADALTVPMNNPSTRAGLKESKETKMELTESQYKALTEKADRVGALEAERDTATKERDEARAALAEAHKAADEAAMNRVIAEAAADFTDLEKAGLRALATESEGRIDIEAFTTAVGEEAAKRNAALGAGTPRGTYAATMTESADLSEDEYLAALGIK